MAKNSLDVSPFARSWEKNGKRMVKTERTWTAVICHFDTVSTRIWNCEIYFQFGWRQNLIYTMTKKQKPKRVDQKKTPESDPKNPNYCLCGGDGAFASKKISRKLRSNLVCPSILPNILRKKRPLPFAPAKTFTSTHQRWIAKSDASCLAFYVCAYV